MTFDYRHVLRAGSIRLGEAANYWAGHDPAIIGPRPKRGHAYRIFNNLKTQCGKLLPKKPADGNAGYMQMITLDDLRRVAEEWDDWPTFLYPEKQSKRRDTVAAQTECGNWLVTLMEAGPSKKTKTEYQSEAKEKFHVGTNAFNRAWGQATGEVKNPTWSKPGPKTNS